MLENGWDVTIVSFVGHVSFDKFCQNKRRLNTAKPPHFTSLAEISESERNWILPNWTLLDSWMPSEAGFLGPLGPLGPLSPCLL